MATWLKLKCHRKYLNSCSESYFNLWHRHTPHDRPSVNVVSAGSIRLRMVVPHWLAHRQLHPKEWSHVKISLSVNQRLWRETWNKAKNLQAVTAVIPEKFCQWKQDLLVWTWSIHKAPKFGVRRPRAKPWLCHFVTARPWAHRSRTLFSDEFEKIRDHKWCIVWPRRWFRKCLN